MQKRPLLILLAAAAGLALFLVLSWGKKPPRELDLAKMASLQAAIESYAAQHGQAPESLEALEVDPALLLDRTGHPIQYAVDGWTVTITSFGGDQKPGGIAFKADHDHSFTLPAPLPKQ